MAKKGLKVNNKNRGARTRAAIQKNGQTNRARAMVQQFMPQNLEMIRRAAPQPSLGDAAMRYAAALTHPFSKEAEGVRVPEPYAVSTIVRKIHVPIVLTSSAGGGLDFTVQPHICNSFVNTLGTMSGGSTLTLTGQPAGLNVRSAVGFTALRAAYQTYRIVAIGVRLKTNVDFTRSGGRVYGAILPASQELPIAFNTGVTLPDALGCYEIPNDGTNVTTSIIGLPRSFQFSTSELMSEGGVEIHFPICSGRALDFLDAQAQEAEQGLVVLTSGLFSKVTGLGVMSAAGHSQFVLRAEGLQASSDVFTAEVIYHIEGIPLVGTASLVEAMPHTPAPASPNEIHLAHRIAAVMPVVSYVSEKLKTAGGGRFSGLASKAGKFANSAEKVLGIAMRGLAL